MPKRVKICLLQNGTESNNTYSYIALDQSDAFGLPRRFFFREQAYQSLSFVGKGGGIEFSTMPPNWAPYTCTTWLWGLHYKTIIGSLWC